MYKMTPYICLSIPEVVETLEGIARGKEGKV
jgi:hypothetical protein